MWANEAYVPVMANEVPSIFRVALVPILLVSDLETFKM